MRRKGRGETAVGSASLPPQCAVGRGGRSPEFHCVTEGFVGPGVAAFVAVFPPFLPAVSDARRSFTFLPSLLPICALPQLLSRTETAFEPLSTL